MAQDDLAAGSQLNVTYSLNGGTPHAMTLARTSWQATFTSARNLNTDLPDGVYNIVITATDEVGNRAQTSIVLVVGNPSPTGLTAASPTNTPALSWDATAGADHYNVYSDGSPTPIASPTQTAYTDNSALTDGNHTYTVSSVNGSGTESPQSAPITVVVDKTAPTVSALNWSANPLLEGQNTTLSATVSDNLTGVGSVSYSLNGGAPQPMTFDSISGTWQATFGQTLGVNTYNVEVVATDSAGNQMTKQDVLAVYNATNGYVTGHAKLLPGASDTLPIAQDTSNNPAKLIIGFTNIKAGTSTTPTSGSFDVNYVVKNNKDEFDLTSTSVDWLVVPDSTHGSILGHGNLTTYVNSVPNVITNVTVRFDISPGSGSATHVVMSIYLPGADLSSPATWIVSEDALTSSNVMIHP
jgi:hypothetical protein